MTDTNRNSRTRGSFQSTRPLLASRSDSSFSSGCQRISPTQESRLFLERERPQFSLTGQLEDDVFSETFQNSIASRRAPFKSPNRWSNSLMDQRRQSGPPSGNRLSPDYLSAVHESSYEEVTSPSTDCLPCTCKHMKHNSYDNNTRSRSVDALESVLLHHCSCCNNGQQLPFSRNGHVRLSESENSKDSNDSASKTSTCCLKYCLFMVANVIINAGLIACGIIYLSPMLKENSRQDICVGCELISRVGADSRHFFVDRNRKCCFHTEEDFFQFIYNISSSKRNQDSNAVSNLTKDDYGKPIAILRNPNTSDSNKDGKIRWKNSGITVRRFGWENECSLKVKQKGYYSVYSKVTTYRNSSSGQSNHHVNVNKYTRHDTTEATGRARQENGFYVSEINAVLNLNVNDLLYLTLEGHYKLEPEQTQVLVYFISV